MTMVQQYEAGARSCRLQIEAAGVRATSEQSMPILNLFGSSIPQIKSWLWRGSGQFKVVQGGGVGLWKSVLRMVRADLVGVDRPG